MQRYILVVDDIRSNREILKNILGDDYRVMEASDGSEALEVMTREYKRLSAVLLDLGMPRLDGFGVLSRMRESETLSQLPVIVMTGQTDSDSEERALRLGAKDYISKPYKSAIIKQRIRNTINLRETAATVNALQRDRLTGLYSRETFFEKAAERVSAREPGYFVMACFDVDKFKVINDQYGTRKGDEVLRHIARVFQEGFAPGGGLTCRVTADNFAVLYPASLLDSGELDRIRERAAAVEGLASPLSFSVGRYIVSDVSLSPSAMYDRATLAEASVKGRYDRHVATYDESMREYLLGEQRIVNEMKTALSEEQFEVWFQPQYNHTTGALIGAEALVRWRHPENGLIPPNSFIPIFEKNGFIFELDKYVWEQTCRYLRKWMDEGRSPLPVSVNISRYDIFCAGLTGILTGLLEKYNIPAASLRLEITESAFTESTRQIVDVVKELIDLGFTVEIDDFGSGYSSLNTLKGVPAQVVKLDMRFLEDDDGSGRGGNILESIVRMTKWLGMSVIAEGVELEEQADFLKSIGCSYVQGYLYARPMPAADYEALCRGAGKEERLLTIETVKNLDNNAFWDPKSMDTLIFNSYVGAACIYEYNGGDIEMLRATDKYAQMLGGTGMTVEDVLKLDLDKHLDPATREQVLGAINESALSKGETTGEFLFLDLPGCPHETYIRSTLRVIASAGKRFLVYCISENITAQRHAEQSERRVMKQLQAIMDNVGCGITAVTMDGAAVRYILANDKYYELLGYTREQYNAEVGSNAFTTLHPQDVSRVKMVMARASASGVPQIMEYRAIRRDGSVIWLRSTISVTSFEDVAGPVQLCIYADLTSEKQAAQELLDNLPGGAALYEFDGESLTAMHLNKRYWELVDRAPVSYEDLSVLEPVHPDDRKIIFDEITSAIACGRDIVCDLRLLHGGGGYLGFHVVGRAVRREDGKYSIYASYTPISDEAMSIQEMLPIALAALMASSSDLSFVKDKNLRYICCSRAFAKMAGLESEREVVGKADADLFEKGFAEKFIADDLELMASGRSIVDMPELIPSEDGREHYSNTSKFLLYDSLENVVGIFGTGRDITEAREIKSQLELLTNSLPGGIAVFEGRPDELDKMKVAYFSDGYCRLFGYTREEYEAISAKNAMSRVFPEDMEAMRGQIAALVRDGTPIDCVYRARVKDGGGRWINVKAVPGEPRGDRLTVNAVLFDVTARQEALERLRVSEEENRLAISHSRNVVCRFSAAERTLTVPPGANPIFGIGGVVADVPYGPVREGMVSPETAGVYAEFYESILRGAKTGTMVYQRMSSAGWRWLEARFSTIFSADGAPVSAVVSFVDVTESYEKDVAYKKWRQSLRERAPESYSLFRGNITKRVSDDTAEGGLLNVRFKPEPSAFDANTAEYAARCVAPEDAERFSAFLSADALLAMFYQGRRSVTLEYREKLPAVGRRWLRLTVDLVESPHSQDVEAYLLFEDIDKAKREELATIERAENDPLTGVLNRATFSARVDRILAASPAGSRHALMMLDIDGFKQVNDVFGHGAGDQALIDVADSLRSALRHGDLIGRLGGDEFVVFLRDIPNDSIAAEKAKQLCALTRRDYSREVETSISVGVTIAPRDGLSFETLYKKSDSALYYVKGSGKDSYAFYHEDMADEHLELERDAPDSSKKKDKKRRMLIVDDSRIDHAMLSSIFADDFIVDKAKDGASALIRLRHYGTAISVVLLDLVMPGLDGFAVLEKMRHTAELRGIPVIVVSGDGERETSLRAIRAGADDFVTKPVDPDVLRIRVRSAISKAENERLRAKNSFLEFQNAEVARYKTVLEYGGTTVIEHDWINGDFLYDASISRRLAGTFDDRGLWHILLSDMVCDTATVRTMQEHIHELASNRKKTGDSLTVRLRTPSRAFHSFRLDAIRVANEYGLTVKIYLALTDLDA